MICTFRQEFDDTLERGPESLGQFRSRYWFGGGGVDSRSLGAEQQIYSDPAYNGVEPCTQWGDSLIITAREGDPKHPKSGGKRYTSGLLTTQKTFDQLYGRFVIKAALPMGTGLWPAFWLLEHADPTIMTAQKINEIDIFEHLGKERVYFTAHHPSLPKVGTVPAGQSQGFVDMAVNYAREYSLDWSEKTLRWQVDGKTVREIPNPGFHKPMYMLINLAVGGWAGAPDPKAFPAQMKIDYIRAYQPG